MESKLDSILYKKSIFWWLALLTALLLFIPLVAMQLTNEVHWQLDDFVVMGCLVFGFSSLFVVIARRVKSRNRWVIGLILLCALLIIWLELAVGILTHWGR